MTRQMTRLAIPLAIAAFLMALALPATPAEADEVLLIAKIDGPQAQSTTCSQGSAGTGFGRVTYDTTTNLLSWNVTFGGLSGPPIDAHFHGPAAPGVSAPITVPMTADLTSPSEGSATISESEEADLLAGLWYINYHTTKCAGGEIRGQVEISVGGIAELPDAASTPLEAPDSSGVSTSLVAALAAAGVAAIAVTLGGTAWYLRRRKA